MLRPLPGAPRRSAEDLSFFIFLVTVVLGVACLYVALLVALHQVDKRISFVNDRLREASRR